MSKDTIQTVNYQDSDDAELYVLAKKETDNGLFKKELKIKAETLSVNDSEKMHSIYIQLRVDDMKKGNLDFFEEDFRRIEKAKLEKEKEKSLNEWLDFRMRKSGSGKKKSFIRRLFE
tara:strand:- start:2663 stop:3013 length:351 start_codon:yes stop_codon:yes gene_type:complete